MIVSRGKFELILASLAVAGRARQQNRAVRCALRPRALDPVARAGRPSPVLARWLPRRVLRTSRQSAEPEEEATCFGTDAADAFVETARRALGAATEGTPSDER